MHCSSGVVHYLNVGVVTVQDDLTIFWVIVLVLTILILVGVIKLFCVPMKIAKNRAHPGRNAIIVLNIVGWFFWPCWLIALCWALNGQGRGPIEKDRGERKPRCPQRTQRKTEDPEKSKTTSGETPPQSLSAPGVGPHLGRLAWVLGSMIVLCILGYGVLRVLHRDHQYPGIEPQRVQRTQRTTEGPENTEKEEKTTEITAQREQPVIGTNMESGIRDMIRIRGRSPV